MLEINHGMKVLRFVGYREPVIIGQYYLDTEGKIIEVTVDTPFVGNRAIFEAKPVTYCFDGVWFQQGDMEVVETGHWYLWDLDLLPFLARTTATPSKLRRLIPINPDHDGGSQAVPENMTVTVTAPIVA